MIIRREMGENEGDKRKIGMRKQGKRKRGKGKWGGRVKRRRKVRM